MVMWLPRIVAEITSAKRPLLLIGGEPFGVPFVVDALRSEMPLAWFELGPATQDDPVAIGNALARSVNAALAGPLLPLALPYRAQINALRRHRADAVPLRIAIDATVIDAQFLRELMELHDHGYRVLVSLVDDAALTSDLLSTCHVIGPEVLALNQAEARALVPGGLRTAVADDLWRETEGKFTQLTARANGIMQLPPLLLPSPSGPTVPEADAVLAEPLPMLRALVRDGQLMSAVELAVLHAPDQVEGLIRQAGPRFQEEGLLSRLHLLLSALPGSYSMTERVLEWRFVAAFAVGDRSRVTEQVDSYLETHAAPELRARRAGVLPAVPGFTMAQEAVRSKRTPLTLWQLGRLHPNHELAVGILRESIEVAEDLGTPYEVARNASTLAARMFHVGHFAAAASWGRWALDVFDQAQLQDGVRRLNILNTLASARIMTGDLGGLRHPLEEGHELAVGAIPNLAALLGATLAQLDLAEGNVTAAVERIVDTYHASARVTRPRYGYQYVRALTELGRMEEAHEVAADVSQITAGDTGVLRSIAALARGMVNALEGADEAENDLMTAMLDRELVAEQRLTAALYYLLVTGGAAHNIPTELAPLLRDVHPVALRVLSGPESRFAAVWATLTGKAPALTFQFLGAVRCRYDGVDVPLAPRLAEVAFALALHPEGMSRDQLNDFLTPEGHAPFSSGGMRGMMTRLRSLLPVSDAPYRFTVPYRADVLEAREHVAAGRVRDAVSLLQGPLLPNSDAPGVDEQRWALEEELRQAALLVGDPDALYDLAERLDDDLEFWEAAADSLSAGDPRLAIARARVRRLAESYGLES